MKMQFEYTATVLGATRMIVEGRPYAFVFVGESPEEDKVSDCHGYSIRKIPADPLVFEQLSDVTVGNPKNKTLLMILKQASGGKSQPHVVGVVSKPSQPTQPSQPAKS